MSPFMSPFVSSDSFSAATSPSDSEHRLPPPFGDARWRAVFNAMSEGMVVHGADGKILDANRAAERVLGLSRDQILGRTSVDPIWRAIHEDGSPYLGETHPAVRTLRTGEPVRNAVMGIRIEGSPDRWISINTEPVVDELAIVATGVVATFVDVTAERLAVAELRQTRADLTAILEHVPARVTAWNLDYTNRFANGHAEHTWQLPAGGAVGKTAQTLLGAERFARALPFIQAALAGTTQSHEQVDPQPDGSARYSWVTYVPKRRHGQVVGLYVLGFDTTPLRLAQDGLRATVRELQASSEALTESEHRLRTIANGVPMAIALFDSAERIVFANGELAKLGPQGGEHAGSPAKEVFPSELYERGREPRARALAGETVRYEVEALVEGELRIREVTYSPYRGVDGVIHGVYALGYDITELHRSRERIRELAQRLAEVREDEKVALSTTLHERIAQELFAARLGLEQLAKGRDAEGVWRSTLSDVSGAIEHTVGELRWLTNTLVPISLSNLPLETTLRLHAEDFGARRGLRVAFHVTAPLPATSVEIRLLVFRAMQQVLENVHEHAQARSVGIEVGTDGESLRLAVSDDGRGMPAAGGAKAGAHGLLLFSERFRGLGGTFDARVGEHGGTTVEARIPLHAACAAKSDGPRSIA